jgi:hypothetical protein
LEKVSVARREAYAIITPVAVFILSFFFHSSIKYESKCTSIAILIPPFKRKQQEQVGITER